MVAAVLEWCREAGAGSASTCTAEADSIGGSDASKKGTVSKGGGVGLEEGLQVAEWYVWPELLVEGGICGFLKRRSPPGLRPKYPALLVGPGYPLLSRRLCRLEYGGLSLVDVCGWLPARLVRAR